MQKQGLNERGARRTFPPAEFQSGAALVRPKFNSERERRATEAAVLAFRSPCVPRKPRSNEAAGTRTRSSTGRHRQGTNLAFFRPGGTDGEPGDFILVVAGGLRAERMVLRVAIRSDSGCGGEISALNGPDCRRDRHPWRLPNRIAHQAIFIRAPHGTTGRYPAEHIRPGRAEGFQCAAGTKTCQRWGHALEMGIGASMGSEGS